MMRPARLNDEYIVRPPTEAEPDDDEAVPVVAVVPRRNIFDNLNPELISNQFEEVV